MTPYECGTCGSSSLRIVGVFGNVGVPDSWRVECINAHPVTPTDGTVLLAEARSGDAADPIPEHFDAVERTLARLTDAVERLALVLEPPSPALPKLPTW